MSGPRIHFPTPEEREATQARLIEELATLRREQAEADAEALPALARLAEVLRERSGQPYKLRSLLWSLWNGKPTSLLEVVNLDRSIRKDLCAVLLAYGSDAVFYDALKAAVTRAGQWDWFVEEWQNVEALEKCLQAVKRAA
jgi:hypothetical protein